MMRIPGFFLNSIRCCATDHYCICSTWHFKSRKSSQLSCGLISIRLSLATYLSELVWRKVPRRNQQTLAFLRLLPFCLILWSFLYHSSTLLPSLDLTFRSGWSKTFIRSQKGSDRYSYLLCFTWQATSPYLIFTRNSVRCVEVTNSKSVLSSHLCIFRFTNNNMTSERSRPPGDGAGKTWIS